MPESHKSCPCPRCNASEKIYFSYYILLHLIPLILGGKKGISGNKTSFFLLMWHPCLYLDCMMPCISDHTSTLKFYHSIFCLVCTQYTRPPHPSQWSQ